MKDLLKKLSMLKIWHLTFLLNTSLLGSELLEEKPFVTAHLHGQLGNQLHIIATTLAYAWDHDMIPIFPDLRNNTEYNIPINYKRLFFKLSATPLPRPILFTFKQPKLFEKIDIPVRADQCLYGFFQSWKYYDHHREKLLKIFSPSAEELCSMQKKYADLLNHSCTVGVHVRTFNKKSNQVFPFIGLDYYEKAISQFPLDALFVIFSDRILWCKHHFSKFSRNMLFMETQDHIEDFILMSMLKHHIIANSSYSWWAAYLNQNPNKLVIAPSHFVYPNRQSIVHANMPDWIIVNIDDHDKFPSYPVDMYDYDTFSLSLDTQ